MSHKQQKHQKLFFKYLHFYNLFVFGNLYPSSTMQWVNLLFPLRTDMPPNSAGKTNKRSESSKRQFDAPDSEKAKLISSRPWHSFNINCFCHSMRWHVEKWQIHVSKRGGVRDRERKWMRAARGEFLFSPQKLILWSELKGAILQMWQMTL